MLFVEKYVSNYIISNMDILYKSLGELALASRLKFLSEKLQQDVEKIYKDLNLDFEPKWFLIYYQLTIHGSMSITEIATAAGYSHPAVNQISSEMMEAGIVVSETCHQDKRKRILSLSEKGKKMNEVLLPLWQYIQRANRELLDDSQIDFLAALDSIEKALEQKSIYARVSDAILNVFNKVELTEYEPAYKAAFKSLNYEWLQKYFTVEPSDEAILSDPETHIVQKNGHIFFAKQNNEIVGTCALLQNQDQSFELCKMAVTEKHREHHIGRILANKAIEKAKTLQAPYVMLYTHPKLTAAIQLYKSLGFTEEKNLPLPQYDREGFAMKLKLQ